MKKKKVMDKMKVSKEEAEFLVVARFGSIEGAKNNKPIRSFSIISKALGKKPQVIKEKILQVLRKRGILSDEWSNLGSLEEHAKLRKRIKLEKKKVEIQCTKITKLSHSIGLN